MRTRLVRALVALFALVAITAIPATVASASQRHGPPGPSHAVHTPVRPVIFVHGFTGSGAQFETQAMRFASNGYPSNLVDVVEYDSTLASTTIPQVWTELDHKIDALLQQSGADKVDLAGHSMGTGVLQGYLNSSPARAARVAHYANLDGAPASSLPGGVPTVAVWGEGHNALSITGATNVYEPDHSHVQVATSAETFAAMYKFFTGHSPRTTDVVPQRRVTLSGKVDLFPSNAGAAGSMMQVWMVDPRTGFRLGHHPLATYTIGADGSFGPFPASNHASYEFAVIWGGTQTQHYYYEPFVRSDHLIRLLTQHPGTGLDLLIPKSPNSSALLFVRYKELWGDQGPANDDVLTVNGQNVLTPAIAPRSKLLNALFAFDNHLDGKTDLSAPISTFDTLPFISGADVFVPGETPPHHTIHIETVQRQGTGDVERINVPNFGSQNDLITVQLRDFVQPSGHGHHGQD